MTLRYPGERTLKVLVRRNDHDARVTALLQLGPRRVYAGLLWIRDQRKYRWGFEKHTFRKLFGTEPRPQDKGPPAQPPVELQEWVDEYVKRGRRNGGATKQTKRGKG